MSSRLRASLSGLAAAILVILLAGVILFGILYVQQRNENHRHRHHQHSGDINGQDLGVALVQGQAITSTGSNTAILLTGGETLLVQSGGVDMTADAFRFSTGGVIVVPEDGSYRFSGSLLLTGLGTPSVTSFVQTTANSLVQYDTKTTNAVGGIVTVTWNTVIPNLRANDGLVLVIITAAQGSRVYANPDRLYVTLKRVGS